TCAYGRHLHGGIAYEDKIYWGYGNWHKASCEIPVDIDAFDPVTNSFTHEFDAQTESVYDYRILSNGNLYIPHIDVHNVTKGVFTCKDYSRKVNGVWSDAEAGAWHVFDIQEMNGNIYLIGSIDNPGVGV